MKSGSSLDWPAIRSRAAMFPDEAFDFVREGLRYSVDALHGAADSKAKIDNLPDESRHITGQQLCTGLRDFALQRYGLLAPVVLGRWGIRRTEDFGTLVYSLIDRKELRSSERDSMADFKDVYDFAEAFATAAIG